jgi:hypothetical protein
MKMNYLKFLFILLLVSSCETLVDDLPLSRFPELKSKMVLHSFISPQDSLITVRLSQSVPLFGEFPIQKSEKFVNTNGDTIQYNISNKEIIIKNAEVTISNGAKAALLKFDLKSSEYFVSAADFPIEAGKTYTIKAKNSEMNVEATTTVPLNQVEIESFKIDSTQNKIVIYQNSSGGSFEEKEISSTAYNVEFNWKDIKSVPNYYKVETTIKSYFQIPKLEKGKVVYNESFNYYYPNWGGQSYAPERKFLKDDNLDGKVIFSPKANLQNCPNYNGFTYNGVLYPIKSGTKNKVLIMKLFNANRDFYENQLSLEKYGFSGGGNPFAEPIQVYSNIKNGLGCFGAFNRSELMVELK